MTAKEGMRAFGYLLPGIRQIADAQEYPIMKPEATQFLIDSITLTINYCCETKSRQNDMIGPMIDAMKGELKNEDKLIPRSVRHQRKEGVKLWMKQ
jgi:hypothetical protein